MSNLETHVEISPQNESSKIAENGNMNSTNNPKNSVLHNVKFFINHITIEPVMICYILPNVMSILTTQNLNLEKSCRVNLHYNVEICDALSARNESAFPDYKHIEEDVQTFTTNMIIYKNITQSVISGIMLVFLGSWSDRHQRRKPVVLNPIIAEVFTLTGLLLGTYFMYQLPLQYNIFMETVPAALTGGWFGMFMGVFSYVSGVSSQESRTLRVGAVHMMFNVSFTIGTALSGILFKKIGFYGVYFTSLAIYFVGLIYGIFFVKEIPKVERVEETVKKNFLVDFFETKRVKETLHVAFKKGQRHRRLRIFCIMVLVVLIVGPLHGELNVVYYFLRYKYGWDALDYSLYSTFVFVLHMCGTLFSLLFFTKYLKMDDALLGIISSMSKIFSSVIYAFAPSSKIFYIGAVVELLNGTCFIAMRSIVSKLVPANELGQINSLFGVCESVVPLIYGPVYSIIYAHTIKFFPGMFFLVGGGMTIPTVFIFLWLYIEHRKDLKEAEIEDLEKNGDSTIKATKHVTAISDDNLGYGQYNDAFAE